MKNYLLPLFAGLLCITFAQAATRTLAYDAGKTAAENGAALQAAIDAASSGDELKVQAGTYIGNFTMKEGVQVSGGWNAGFSTQTDYATILDANASGRVVNQAAEFSTLTVWSNLTIQNGNVTGTGGGVLLCANGQVKHCMISHNTATTQGGGVYCDDSNAGVVIDDCIISYNSANQGGGLRIRGIVQNSTIEQNTITDSGGGMHLQAATAINCLVRNNNAKGGAGIRAYGGVVRECIIENNTTTTSNSGGVMLQNGAAMYNSVIRNNSCGENTGGVRMTYDNSKSCTMANCLITGNTATGTIGGVSLEGGIHYVYNNTIVNNSQTSSSNANRCGVRLNVNSNLVFANNIVWGNKANGSVQADQMEIHATYASDRSATYFLNNAVVHANVGTNTIVLSSTDPGFTNAASGYYTLLESSSLVDAGNNSKAQGLYDLSGNARISGTTVDIGCYEYQYPIIVDNYVHSDEDLQEAIDATSAGTTVYVQAGTYYGNFTMKDGVNVSGGWNEDFTEQTDYATILDAQESGRVVNQPADFSNLTVWENLTIQKGKLIENIDTYGAGVFLRKKGQVKHCIIQDNTFTYSGKNCMGGGVANDAVNANTDVLVDDCIIRRNQGTHGGGVRIKGTIQNSIIEENTTTTNAGGGAHIHTGRMVNCIVRNNTSGGDVGGIRMYGKGQLINTLVIGNTATGKVGGVGVEVNNSDIIGCTIVGNDQLVNDASHNTKCGLSCGASSDNGTKLANNIIWGNKHNGVVQEGQIYYVSHYNAANRTNNAVTNQLTHNDGSCIRLSMSNTENSTCVDGSGDEQPTYAPHFADPENGDYRLTWQSPMFNRGSNSIASSYSITKDLDGEARTKGGVVDYGCYEFDAVILSISNSHSILTVREKVCEGSSVAIPKGYTGTANVVAEDGYLLNSVTFNSSPVVLDGEGNFTIPTMNADAALAISTSELTYYNRSVTEGRFGTICLGYAVPAGAIAGAKVYKVISFASDEKVGLLLEEVNTMVAGKPYFFVAEADEVSFGYVAEGDAAVAGDENGLHGTLAEEAISGADYYVLQNNLLCPVTAGDITLAANRAYLMFSEVPDYEEAAPSPIRRVITIQQTENTATGTDQMVNDKSVNGKFIHDGQLLIIRDGKTYNVLGL